MLILDKIWDGTFPCEDFLHNDREYFDMMHEVLKMETSLREHLSDEEKKAMEQLLEKNSEASFLAHRDAFAWGVRYGAMIMIDVFCEQW